MSGGIISKSILSKPLEIKIAVALGLQLLIAAAMIVISYFYASNLYTLLFFVVLLNITSGFVFNNLFAYCLSRFSGNAGIVSGLTGGSLFVITSILAYGVVNLLHIDNQVLLGVGYLIFIVLNVMVFAFFQKNRAKSRKIAIA
jgi:hypothetical protein